MRARNIVIGGAAIGTAGWVIYRVTQRARLQKLLDDSPAVAVAQSTGAIDWTAKEKAEEAITFFNTISADQAFSEILASLPLPDPRLLEDVWDMGKDLTEQGEDLFGLPRGTINEQTAAWTDYAQSWVDWWRGDNA